MSNGLKRKFEDEQFEFPSIPREWPNGKNQKVLGLDFVTYEPVREIDQEPGLVEFEFKDSEAIWAFGPNTRFKIEGQFQCMTPGKEGVPEIPWAAVTDAECDKVIVSPNYLEAMIEKIEIFHGNTPINFSNEDKFISPFLNTFKYAYMDKLQKKRLCLQDACTGLGIPKKIGDWSMTDENSEWRKNFGPKIFIGNEFLSIDWNPLDTPPFMQNCNYLEKISKVFPISILEKIRLCITFNNNRDSIFKKIEGNEKIYRFVFKKFNLLVEELRLNPLFKDSFLKQKGVFEYSGVTRFMKSFKIPEKVSNFKARIQNVTFPEGVFIFAIPKRVPDGNYSYSENVDGNVFEKHNINIIDFTYKDQPIFSSVPNIGMIDNDIIQTKLLNDYYDTPPFGMKMNLDQINMNMVKNGGINTPYPHVYINFCNYLSKSRILPPMDNGTIYEKDYNLDLKISFNDKGAAANVVYIVYLFYTDVNLILDTKSIDKPFFKSPYLKMY